MSNICIKSLFTQPNLEGFEIHEVALKKKEGQSLGISIIGYNALTNEGKIHAFPLIPFHATPNEYAVNNYFLASCLFARQMLWGSS